MPIFSVLGAVHCSDKVPMNESGLPPSGNIT